MVWSELCLGPEMEMTFMAMAGGQGGNMERILLKRECPEPWEFFYAPYRGSEEMKEKMERRRTERRGVRHMMQSPDVDNFFSAERISTLGRFTPRF